MQSYQARQQLDSSENPHHSNLIRGGGSSSKNVVARGIAEESVEDLFFSQGNLGSQYGDIFYSARSHLSKR